MGVLGCDPENKNFLNDVSVTTFSAATLESIFILLNVETIYKNKS